MINYTPTPDFYNDYIQHFNPFHDPRNGQFATGHGGGSITRLQKKAAKATAKAAKANKKAAQAGNDFLHPFKAKKKDKLQTKAFKAQYKADKLNAKLNKEEFKENKRKQFEEEFNKIRNTAKTDEEKDKRIRELEDSYAKNSNKIVDTSLKGTKELEKELASQFLSKQSGADSYAKKQLSKTDQQKIGKEVKRARETGMYDMEFLERNLDLDPVTEEPMKGKAIDNAYKKFLEDELKKNNK